MYYSTNLRTSSLHTSTSTCTLNRKIPFSRTAASNLICIDNMYVLVGLLSTLLLGTCRLNSKVPFSTTAALNLIGIRYTQNMIPNILVPVPIDLSFKVQVTCTYSCSCIHSTVNAAFDLDVPDIKFVARFFILLFHLERARASTQPRR